jgi:hypothetical protein
MLYFVTFCVYFLLSSLLAMPVMTVSEKSKLRSAEFRDGTIVGVDCRRRSSLLERGECLTSWR